MLPYVGSPEPELGSVAESITRHLARLLVLSSPRRRC